MATSDLISRPALSSGRTLALAMHLRQGGTLWLVSDVHANRSALNAWFAQLGAEDAVVLMGDLLTYGCNPKETLELIERCLSTRTSALLVGNHDVLYRDILDGDTRYYDKLPDWIRESVDWTLRQIDGRWFANGLPWANEVTLGNILIAHANPYVHGDWTYLDSREDYRRALQVLGERGFQLGIFGHVHRPRLLSQAQQGEQWITKLVHEYQVAAGMSVAWNVGSLGQQRSENPCASVGSLRRRESGFELRHHAVPYDVQAHLDSIRGAGLSERTTERLSSYYLREIQTSEGAS